MLRWIDATWPHQDKSHHTFVVEVEATGDALAGRADAAGAAHAVGAEAGRRDDGALQVRRVIGGAATVPGQPLVYAAVSRVLLLHIQHTLGLVLQRYGRARVANGYPVHL